MFGLGALNRLAGGRFLATGARTAQRVRQLWWMNGNAKYVPGTVSIAASGATKRVIFCRGAVAHPVGSAVPFPGPPAFLEYASGDLSPNKACRVSYERNPVTAAGTGRK
jgi:hypothetical protein